jgi:D-alanyl-D-alanine carboxypeptidase
VRRLAPLLLLGLLAPACGDDGATAATPPPWTAPPPPAYFDLDGWVADELTAFPELPGEIVLVDSPRVRAVTAQGVADGLGGDEPLTAQHEFRIASVTKTFVAATVLRLAEQGELGLDDPIDAHLPPQFLDLLTGDGYDVGRITVAHLLGHTGGLYDFAFDDEYVALALLEPEHRWTPAEQVRFAMTHGDPLADPGDGFAYSDTGYVLAGQVIEAVTGRPLADAVRTTLDFDGLGLDHTYFESLEPAPVPVPPRLHNLAGEIDMWQADPSVDLYGGGGLVSTVDDLATFYGGLFGGLVFDDPSTLDRMTTVSEVSGRDRAGLGLFRVEAAGVTCFEHGGFYGTVAFHCPSVALTIIREVGQAVPSDDFSFADLNIRVVAALT